jgi:hypothetical protein
MVEQQQQSSSSGTSGTGGRPSNRPPSTAGDKGGGGGANAAKKAKNKRNNERKKKNNQQQKKGTSKTTFIGGVTDTTDHLYGVAIDPSANMNMANQCRKLVTQLKLHCNHKHMYKLSASIDSGVTLKRDDFLSPMPDPAKYSKEVTDSSTGEVSLVVTNPGTNR